MNKFAKYTWFVLAYNVLVVLWGAVVRATGSGAGCGNHWPKCNGEIIPRPEQIETVIEFAHRLTSAFAGVLVIILLVWAYRQYAKGSMVRKWALAAFIFIVIEGWVGMLLVRLDLVADNASSGRAFVVALHLANTLTLLATIAITAWLASGNQAVVRRKDRKLDWLIGSGLLAMLLLSAAGAVTALGDTLFPATSLAEGLRQDFDPASNFLIQLRVYHPVLAIIVSYYLFRIGGWIKERDLGAIVVRLVNGLYLVVALQILAGFITIFLLAPLFMQILHLLLADVFWLLLVVLSANVLTISEQSA